MRKITASICTVDISYKITIFNTCIQYYIQNFDDNFHNIFYMTMAENLTQKNSLTILTIVNNLMDQNKRNCGVKLI